MNKRWKKNASEKGLSPSPSANQTALAICLILSIFLFFDRVKGITTTKDLQRRFGDNTF